MIDLESIRDRLKEAQEWGDRCLCRKGWFDEGMYPQPKLVDDLPALIAEVDRLRKIEDAAKEVGGHYPENENMPDVPLKAKVVALRIALAWKEKR